MVKLKVKFNEMWKFDPLSDQNISEKPFSVLKQVVADL